MLPPAYGNSLRGQQVLVSQSNLTIAISAMPGTLGIQLDGTEKRASNARRSALRSTTESKHPAVFSKELKPVFLDVLKNYGDSYLPLLDPFAGVGGVHYLRAHGYDTVGVELEPEWARQSPYTLVGDATHLPFEDEIFGTILTSCCYGNRMADSHVAKDGSYRRTYTHVLGRKLHKRNAGSMQWGTKYRLLHEQAWSEAVRVLSPNGLFVLNIKDHQRDFRRMHVSEWHHKTIMRLGLGLVDIRRVSTPGFRQGENWQFRYPERVLVYRKY